MLRRTCQPRRALWTRGPARCFGIVALIGLAGCQSLDGERLARTLRAQRDARDLAIAAKYTPRNVASSSDTELATDGPRLAFQEATEPRVDPDIVPAKAEEPDPAIRHAAGAPPSLERVVPQGLTISPADEAKPTTEATDEPVPSTAKDVIAAKPVEAPVVTHSPSRIVMAPARIAGVYGVGPDEAGLLDNVSGRVGADFLRFNGDSSVGVVGILEGSMQVLRDRAYFVHGGVGIGSVGNNWPMTSTIAVSKLAKIEGGEVTRPLILSAAYDSYLDNGFLRPNKDSYLDEFRGLAGWAVRPWLDVGVWGAIAGQPKSLVLTGFGQPGILTTGFANRAAGYFACDIPRFRSFIINSAGWQEGSAQYFLESDLWVGITRGINFWGGVGYSGNNFVDGAVGLEVIPAGLFKKKVLAACDPCDPCCDPCANVCGDPCAPSYRGGWANGVYRGALRVQTPARAIRSDPPSVTGGPVAQSSGSASGTPPDTGACPCPPRVQGRPVRAGNLSRAIQNGQTFPGWP